MLSKITWSQFGAVMLVGLVVYYAVVLGKFYRKEISGFLSGKKPASGAAPAAASASPAAVPAGQTGRTDPKDQVPEMYKVMEKVIAQLKGVLESGLAHNAGADELTDQIRDVLLRYGQLKKTPYQVSINNYLTRACAAQFALSLDEAELESLWG